MLTIEAIKKRLGELSPQDIIPTIFDFSAKSFFANPDNILITKLLVSSVLEVPESSLKELEFLPLETPTDTIISNNIERDLVLKVKCNDKEYILNFEFNYFTNDWKRRFKHIKIDEDKEKILSNEHLVKILRNLIYIFRNAGRMEIGEDYLSYRIPKLINFNTFTTGEYEDIIDRYSLLNKHDEEYTKIFKSLEILNLDVVKNYNLWYNSIKEEARNIYEKNLFLLSCILATDKIEDVEKIVKELETSNETKEKIVEVIKKMNTNELFWSVYYDKDEETKKYRKTLEKLCEKDFVEKGKAEGLTLGRAEGIASKERDMVINMYKANEVLDKISKYTELPIKKIKQIIGDYLKK